MNSDCKRLGEGSRKELTFQCDVAGNLFKEPSFLISGSTSYQEERTNPLEVRDKISSVPLYPDQELRRLVI